MAFALRVLFPILLIAFEWGLRTAMGVDASGFTGPTLAAAGLTTLIPLTEAKRIPVKVRNRPDAIVISKLDAAFIHFTWIVVLVSILVWGCACYLSIKLPEHQTFAFSSHAALGSFAYIVAVLMSVAKERV